MSVIILFCLSFLLVEYISWHFKGEKVQKNTQIVMCFLLLFIFFGFRDLPILNDTAHYYRHVRHLFSNTPFDNTPWYTFDSSSNFEEGFQIFLRIIGLVISKEPYSLIIITSFITTASIDGVRHAPVTYALGCHDVKLWVLGKIPRERPDWLESAEYIGGRDT